MLNHYTLDAIVEKYDYSETEMAKNHYEAINKEQLLGTLRQLE